MSASDRHEEKNEQRAPKRKKKLKRWPFVLTFFGLLVFFAPAVIGSTGLLEKLVNWNFAHYDGNIKVESASLGWFSPVKLTGLTVNDANGNCLLACDEANTSNSLVNFMFASDYGDLSLQKPIAHIHFRDGSSNLEDELAKMFPVDDTETDDLQLPKLNLSVNDGRIVIYGNAPNEEHAISIDNGIILLGKAGAPVDLAMDLSIPSSELDRMRIRGVVDQDASELSADSIAVDIESSQMSVAFLGPILERFIGPNQLEGRLNGQLTIAAKASQRAVSISSDGASLTSLTLRAPKLIDNDQLSSKAIGFAGNAVVSANGIAAQQVKLSSEHGTVNANGRFDFGQLADMANNDQFVIEPFQLDGQLDLARLVPMLNSTLHLHQDLQIESGLIQFQVNTRRENEQDRLVVNLDMANLQAKRGQQTLAWQKPLRIAGKLHRQNGQLTISDAECTTDFLELRGGGTIPQGAVELQGDLQLMANRIGQFVNLDGIKLEGMLNGNIAWKSETSNVNSTQKPIQLGGEFIILQPLIQWPGLDAWQPNQLTVQVRGSGQTNGQQVSVEQGGMQIDVGTEKLIAVLDQPIANLWTTPQWELNCQATGQLGKWLGHVSNFADLGTLKNGDGTIEVNCLARIDSNNIRLEQLAYNANQFRFDGYGLAIREQTVRGKGGLVYDMGTGWTSIKNLTANAGSVNLHGHDLRVLFSDKMMVEGAVDFRAGIDRIASWYGFSSTPESIMWTGDAEGSIAFQSDEKGIHGRLKSDVNNFVAAQRVSIPNATQPMQMVSRQQGIAELWKESKIQIDGNLTFGHDFDSIAFSDLTAIGNSLAIKTTGQIADLTNQWQTKAVGQWNPNWEMVNQMAQKYTGDQVSLTGRNVQSFSIDGPLFDLVTEGNSNPSWIPARLTAQTSVHLEQGNLFHLPLGQSSIEIALVDGIATINANNMPFAQGFANLAPRINLRNESPTLELASAKVLDRVELNGETCQKWLKYVAPLLADATAAQGRLSLTSQELKIPLEDPVRISAQGTIELIDANVSAGPLSQQLINTANQIKSILKRAPNATVANIDKPWIQLARQSVPYTVQNGRVYHEGLTFAHKDISFTTTGSVGFDQTLYLVAKIPIDEKWIEGDRWLAGLKGQFISIPISGTVTRPVLDRRALQQLSQQLIRSGAQSAINNAIGDKLNEKVDQFKSKLGGQLEDQLKGGLENLFKKKDQ